LIRVHSDLGLAPTRLFRAVAAAPARTASPRRVIRAVLVGVFIDGLERGPFSRIRRVLSRENPPVAYLSIRSWNRWDYIRPDDQISVQKLKFPVVKYRCRGAPIDGLKSARQPRMRSKHGGARPGAAILQTPEQEGNQASTRHGKCPRTDGLFGHRRQCLSHLYVKYIRRASALSRQNFARVSIANRRHFPINGEAPVKQLLIYLNLFVSLVYGGSLAARGVRTPRHQVSAASQNLRDSAAKINSLHFV
jgi:hypothetical protein